MCPQACVKGVAATFYSLAVAVSAARMVLTDKTASAGACEGLTPASGFCNDLNVPMAGPARWYDAGPCGKSSAEYIERYIWRGGKLEEFTSHRHVDVVITQTFACKIVDNQCVPAERDCDGLTLDERMATIVEERERSRTGDDSCNDPDDNFLVRTWHSRDEESGVSTPCSELRSGPKRCFAWCDLTGLCEYRYKQLMGGDLLVRDFQKHCRGIGEKRRQVHQRGQREEYNREDKQRLQELPVCGSKGFKPKELQQKVKHHGVNPSAVFECDISYTHCQCWNCQTCQGGGYDPGEGTVSSWSCTGDRVDWWDGRICPLERPT